MHLNTTNTIIASTLFPESPPACPGSASFLDVSGLPAQGDFLFSDDPIVNWFDSQTEDTARFWIDRAVEMFGLHDSATPRQCWDAFCASATVGVRPVLPPLTTHAAVVRVLGQPRFIAYLPPGMLRRGDNGGVAPFWYAEQFRAHLDFLVSHGYRVFFPVATLRAHGYRVTFPSLCVASVLPPVLGAAS